MSDAERERWNQRHAERGFFPREPSRILTSLSDHLPAPPARALDVAGGTGRHSLWLAERGLDVTLVDVSQVAIALALREAQLRGVSIRTICGDLESPDTLAGLAGPWDVILSFHYLAPRSASLADPPVAGRPLLLHLAENLSESGRLIVVHPTVRNRERHPRPSVHLLDEGELLEWGRVAGLRVLHAEEGWLVEGRHEAVLVAARNSLGPAASAALRES
ncbi:MAG: class I SAM-dependent methyltransferase [Planctomycetota bacterium]